MAGYRQRLRPGDIRFTQDSVGSRFTDGRFVSDTFHQLLDGRISVDDIPAIEAVVDGGEWWAVTGNRRLYVFRLLETLGVVQTIPVDVMSMNSYDVRRRLGDRKTTSCGGRTIEMRQPEAERRINQAIREWQKTNRCTYRSKILANEALEPSASRGRLLENEETGGGGGWEDTRNLISDTRENQRKSRKYQTATHSVAQTNVEPIIRGVSQNSGSRRDVLWPNESSGRSAAIENARKVGQRRSAATPNPNQRNASSSNYESEDSVVTRQPRSLNQDENRPNSRDDSDGFCANRCRFCCS